MCLAGAALRKSKTAALTMSFNRSCEGNCFWYVRLFNEGDPINFYAVLCLTPQELYDTLENDLAVEKEVQNPQRDWFRLNYCVIHLFLWSSLIQYCVFRQKNARKVRNVLAGGSGVFVLLRKFCQMDCKRSCCFQQCFPHFWWTSKIDCIPLCFSRKHNVQSDTA